MKDNVVKINITDKNTPEAIANYPNRNWIEAGIKILREKGVHSLSIKSLLEQMNLEETEFRGNRI